MRKTTRIPFAVLVINAVVMVAGLLLGPDTAGSAFFVVSIGIGAHAGHWLEQAIECVQASLTRPEPGTEAAQLR